MQTFGLKLKEERTKGIFIHGIISHFDFRNPAFEELTSRRKTCQNCLDNLYVIQESNYILGRSMSAVLVHWIHVVVTNLTVQDMC